MDNIIKKSIENIKQYIKTNNYNLKILKDIGEYSYVIKFISFNDYGLNITLQLNNDLNLSNSNLIISQLKQNKYSENKLKQLEENSLNYLKHIDPNNEYFLIKFYEKLFSYIDENFEKSQPLSPKKLKEQKKKETDSNDDDSNSKKSMKTANDVVNRIQWDEEINKDYIIVGYLDRFLGLKECNFNTFDWGDIVLADLGALAIPEHRINYFKYKNEIIWDKRTRFDNIFGSTGSNITIRDVIKRLENVFYVPVEDQKEEINKIGRASSLSSEIKENNLSDNPNYFISIPINSYEIKSNIFDLTCDLIDENESVKNYLVPDSSIHLTICTLRIDSNEELDLVKRVLKSLETDQGFIEKNFSFNINFKGIDSFYDKVLYIKLEQNLEKLNQLKEYILNRLNESKINTAGNYYEFKPHLTVFKIKSNSNNNNGKFNVENLVNRFLWDKYKDFYFGQMKLCVLDLCKMVDIYSFKTYPVEFSLKIDQN